MEHFELTIPKELYLDWHRCFVFHKLALEAIREKLGSPVWLSDKRIQAVSNSSIDRSTVDLDKGEMSFAMFSYSDGIQEIIRGSASSIDKLNKISKLAGESALPVYLMRFVQRTMLLGDKSVSIRNPVSIHNSKDADHAKIERKKGLMGQTKREGEEAIHHFGIFYNEQGKARIFYKFNGTIQFIKNTKND